MEFNHKMAIHRVILILYIFIYSIMYAENCSCCIVEEYFNDSILSHHITMLDINLASTQPILYRYNLNTSSCQGDISINVEYKIIAPEIEINTFETIMTGSISLESYLNYFTNNEIRSTIMPNASGNKKLERLIAYISQTGRLPNGKYLFYFTLKSDLESYSSTKLIEIQAPLILELISPGGSITELSGSYTHSVTPLFNWYSDYCLQCEFGIRVSEYNPDYHESLEAALSNGSLLPLDQSVQFHSLGWNTNSYQYPSVGHFDLITGKYYVWQIRRSYDTTLGKYHDYSSINVFELRPTNKSQLDYSDPYISLIESIIGEEQFYLWFSPGGELERFKTSGDIIWVNNEEMHIDGLHSILSEIKQDKIMIEEIRIK